MIFTKDGRRFAVWFTSRGWEAMPISDSLYDAFFDRREWR